MLITDGHLDLAWNALQWSRDVLRPVHATRVQEAEHSDPLYGHGTVALPEMRQGRVVLCLATLLARSTGTSSVDLDTIADLQKLSGLLTKRGHPQVDVAAIMHGDWLRLLGQNLSARS